MSTIASTGGGGSTGGGSTGYSGSTGGSTGMSAGAWGEDWRTRMASGDEQEAKQLGRYESPEQVWKKARELEKRLSSGELRSTLKKDATPEEAARWRQENGLPAKPEDYKINMPAGKQPPPDDDSFLKGFLATAHASNFTQNQVDQAINSFYAEVDRQLKATGEAERAAELATEEKLRQEWGVDYQVNKTMAEGLLARAPAGFRDKFMNGYLNDHTPIKASPEAWKWLVQMEREINPAATVVPAGSGDPGKTIGVEINDLKAMMANPGSKYWKGPEAEALQERYRQLVDADRKIKERAQA